MLALAAELSTKLGGDGESASPVLFAVEVLVVVLIVFAFLKYIAARRR